MNTALHAPAPGAALDDLDALWRSLLAGKDGEFPQSWLELQCAMLPGVRHGLLVLGAADVGPYAPQATWPAGDAAAVRALAEVAESALAERRALVLRLAGSFGIAVPVQLEGRLHGVAVLEIAPRSEEQAQLALRQLQWGVAWIELHLRRQALAEGHGIQERLMTALDLVVTVLNETRFDAACRALVTELAMRLDCDRVSLGVVRMGHCQVLAMSHSAQFSKRMNLTHAVGAAMDEAIDQKTVMIHPPGEGEVLVTRDHERLAHDHGSGSILTVPFSGAGDDFVGAVSFERPAHQPFDAAAVELCQSVIAVLSRLLEAKRANDRPLAARIVDAAREQGRKLAGPRYVTRKVAAATLVFLLLFFTFATGQYRVTAPSTLEGAVRRTLAAPFDGYIATSDRRAGDVVRAGTVLATLDDRDLRLERLKWASQFAQYSKQYQEAVAGHDRAKAQIAQAQADQARAQMSLAEEQMARATVRAPFDGIVAKGDLSQSLGAGVRRGDTLFELTPLDAYRVIVQVDEGEITDVAVGQKGTLVLASISDEPFGLAVTSVTPVTTSKDGRNYFRVEASLERVSERLRPGMEGVAKVEIGERKLIWIWTHRMMNWLRLFFWTWWP